MENDRLPEGSRRERAIAAFRAENARDPHQIADAGELRPRELLDSERLAAWIAKLEPSPSEALELAAHCQHLCRWQIPRADFEPGRIGYLKWRKALARFHADKSAAILRSAGYEGDTIAAVRQINLKQDLKANADVQTMEDALCLSFLEHELADFAALHPEEKVIDIIVKTWGKMSARAHALALALALPPASAALVQQALARAGAAPSPGG